MKRFLLPLFLACSSPESSPIARIPEGDYTLRVFVDRSEGACGWVKDLFTMPMRVDSSGQIASPMPGVNCATTYGDLIAFECAGFGAKLTARGMLDPNGAHGTGDVRGNVGGCTFAAFTFGLERR